jgi:hypothetical protein
VDGLVGVHTADLKVLSGGAVDFGQSPTPQRGRRAAIDAVQGFRACGDAEIRACLWSAHRYLLAFSAPVRRGGEYVVWYSFSTRLNDQLAVFRTAEITLRFEGNWKVVGYKTLSGGELGPP